MTKRGCNNEKSTVHRISYYFHYCSSSSQLSIFRMDLPAKGSKMHNEIADAKGRGCFQASFFPCPYALSKSLSAASKARPGRPRNPTMAALSTLRGILNPAYPPIIFIINKTIPPSKTLNKIFNTCLRLTENILPSKNRIIIPKIYAIRVPKSTFMI